MLFKKPSFGLNISDYSAEVISLGGTISNPRLLAMGRAVLEPGIFEDGKILDKEKLVKTLKNLIEKPKFGRIKHPLYGYPRFIFAIPESKSYIHVVSLPKGLKRNQIEEFVKSQASQTFPYDLERIYFDYQILDEEVLLVATPKKIVTDYLEVFKSCELEPLVLEIESISLGRALIGSLKEPILIVDIGARTTNFNIFDERGLRLSISISVAGDQFTKSIAEKLKIAPQQAEDLKRKIGLNPKPQKGRIFLILQKEIQAIIQEIKKIEKYFKDKTGKKIEKIILAGGSASLPHLLVYLAENLEIPIEIGDPWVKINIDILRKKEYLKEALGVNPILYSTAIGSALRGLTKNPKKVGINLIRNIKI